MTADPDVPPRYPWPMVVFAAVCVAVGIVLVYVLLWVPLFESTRLYVGRRTLYLGLVCVAPFAAAVAAVRAMREERADQLRRRAASRKLDLREKLAPHPVEPRGPAVDDGPFRTAPAAPAIVIRAATPPAATEAPLVPGAGEPPKLLT